MIALRAMALACRELGDLETAESHLRRAIATSGAPAERLAQARFVAGERARTQRGHAAAGAARGRHGVGLPVAARPRAKLDTQRAVALAHLGRHQEAVASCDRALAVLAEAPGTIDDQRFRAGGLLNRGLVHAYQGRWTQATRGHRLLSRTVAARGAGAPGQAGRGQPALSRRTAGRHPRGLRPLPACEDTLFGYPERLATMAGRLRGRAAGGPPTWRGEGDAQPGRT
ncbi:tetratricopeptide repeat protein [Nonomuraea dietziae]|uniref:tetratricopeptide repeat protein n=1 Tax=Nonomuraea dietziae TaxID=65515 RepID=UPI0031CE8FD1